MKKTILSGIRATGRLHFGNYIGAVQNFVRYQQVEDNTCLYFIADAHTLTTLKDPAQLRGNVLEVAKDYLAAGLDPERSILYAQSSVPEIFELAIYLGMFQPLPELMIVPTYKELVRKHPDQVSHGLLTYPVLMAADILGPRATLVPVGEDQVPNVELARRLAKRFNSRFGDIFVIPEMMPDMVKIPGLDGTKMGKSDASNAIDIASSIEEIREKYYRHGVTDLERVTKTTPGDPYNRCKSIYPVHEVITAGESETRSIAQQCLAGTIGCRDCKKILVDRIEQIIVPFQEKRQLLAGQDDFVRDVLAEGGKKARERFTETLAAVRAAIGIVRY